MDKNPNISEQAHAAKDSPTLQENHIGAAEREVGQFIYRRIERLMDAKPNTPELAELDYLSHIVSDVEEYGADGTEDRTHPFAVPTLQDEGVRSALEAVRDAVLGMLPRTVDGLLCHYDREHVRRAFDKAIAAHSESAALSRGSQS